MPRQKSNKTCPLCGEQGAIVVKTRYSKRLGRPVKFYYFVHSHKDAHGKWRLKWHYYGCDHKIVILETEKPTKAWETS
ncbi:MAG: hypothetical protein QXZ17_05770 [Nitrososphaerota archaeon]